MIEWFDNAPRRVLAAIAATGVAMLAFGLYLQHAARRIIKPLDHESFLK